MNDVSEAEESLEIQQERPCMGVPDYEIRKPN